MLCILLPLLDLWLGALTQCPFWVERSSRALRTILYVIILFILAGLAEIGGGWLVWQWLRAGRPLHWAVGGSLLLVLYGIIPTLQPETHFGRVYAAYGGVFVLLSLLWGWRMNGWQPDRYDLTGAFVVLVGITIMLAAQRT
jgi:small multidrug resistance family-3 protein